MIYVKIIENFKQILFQSIVSGEIINFTIYVQSFSMRGISKVNDIRKISFSLFIRLKLDHLTKSI